MALEATRHSSAWVGEAAAILRAVSAHPILATQAGGSTSDDDNDDDDDDNDDDDDDSGGTDEDSQNTESVEDTEQRYREVLGALGIPVGDGVRGCDRAVDALVGLWKDLDADHDAMAMVRAYIQYWPPSRKALSWFLADARQSCDDSAETDSNNNNNSNNSDSSDGGGGGNCRAPSLVEALGNVARLAARKRAFAEAQRFALYTTTASLCASVDDAQYLIVCTQGYAYHEYDMGVLVAIARGEAANGAGTLLGRAYRQGGIFEDADLPPVPVLGSLPLRLQPYVGFVPALLAVALDHRAVCDDGAQSARDFVRKDEEEDYSGNDDMRSWDNDDEEDIRDELVLDNPEPFPRYPAHWHDAASAAVASLMIPAVSPVDVPPCVILKHIPMAYTRRVARYAWVTEGELERLLAAIAGQHALSIVGLARRTVHPRPPVETGQHVIYIGRRRHGKAKEKRPAARPVHTFCPKTLAVQARDAAVRSRTRVALDPASLPYEIANPLALAIWVDECTIAGAAAATDDSCARHSAERLLDVARCWGVGPSPAQLQTPRILCGALARHAVARALSVDGARVMPESVTRIGPPLLTTAEHEAIVEVCTAPKARRFLWTTSDDIGALVRSVLWADLWLTRIKSNEPPSDGSEIDFFNIDPDEDLFAFEAGAVAERVRAILIDANEQHNARPVERTRARRRRTVETRVQVMLAIAAVRSGLVVRAADLADAGSAAALLAPLDALFP
jgi:hypothetical protein